MEVAKRSYTYDNLARRVTRVTQREGNVAVTDSFTYNGKGELTSATVNGTAYGYAYDTPSFGTSTATGDVTQPIQWSSEYADTDLALTYYSYRHYNPTDGRWISRDPIGEKGGYNLYGFVGNRVGHISDILGLVINPQQGEEFIRQLHEDIRHPVDDIKESVEETYSANSEEAKKICNKYTTIEITKCKDNDKFIEDFYPPLALKICKDFVAMYTNKKGKLKDAVLCVAECLTEEEKKDRAHICCSKRNSERLYSHAKCYTECGFIPEVYRYFLGMPPGGFRVGFTSLVPDAIAESPPVKATVEYARREGKAISDGLKNNPNNAKYTLPGYF